MMKGGQRLSTKIFPSFQGVPTLKAKAARSEMKVKAKNKMKYLTSVSSRSVPLFWRACSESCFIL